MVSGVTNAKGLQNFLVFLPASEVGQNSGEATQCQPAHTGKHSAEVKSGHPAVVDKMQQGKSLSLPKKKKKKKLMCTT